MLFRIMAIFISFSSAGELYANTSRFTDQQVRQVERLLERKLEQNNPSQDTVFKVYTVAGRELLQLGMTESSIKYYGNAANLSVNQNKSEAFISLVASNLSLQKKDAAKGWYAKAKKWFDENPQYQDDSTRLVMDYFTAVIESESDDYDHDKFQSRFAETLFSYDLELRNLRRLLQKNSFLDAYAMFKSQPDQHTNFEIRVTYDLLSHLVGLPKQTLTCESSLRADVEAVSPATRICQLLQKRKNDQEAKFDASELDEMRALSQEFYPQQLHLIQAVRSL